MSFRFVTNYLQSLHSSGLCCLLIAGIVSHNSLYFFALRSWQLARLVSRLVSRPLLLLPRPNCPHIRCPHFWLLVEICFHSTQKKVRGILGEKTNSSKYSWQAATWQDIICKQIVVNLLQSLLFGKGCQPLRSLCQHVSQHRAFKRYPVPVQNASNTTGINCQQQLFCLINIQCTWGWAGWI